MLMDRKITAFSTYNDASQNFAGRINSATTHFIGRHAPSSTQYLDANLSQVYFLDGQSLGPGFFGFNDPLTNTWRPKKLTRNDTGVNDGSVWSSNSTNWTDPAQVLTVSLETMQKYLQVRQREHLHFQRQYKYKTV